MEKSLENKEMDRRSRIYARDYIGWWVYASIQFFFCALPARLAYAFASLLGDSMFIFSKRNRRIIEHNLRAALSLKESLVRKYTRRICRDFYRNLVDFLRFSKFDKKWLRERSEIIGIENVKEAFSRGKGVIAISLHMGSWEIGALMIAMAGFPTNGIWASHINPKVDEFFIRPRVKKGIKVITTGGAIKEALKALEANELVFFVMDHSYNKKGVEVDFFNQKTIIPKGPALAALKSKAAILPIVAIRGEHSEHKLVCGEIVEYALSGDEKRDIYEITQKCIKVVEGFIRKYPDQWVLFRKY